MVADVQILEKNGAGPSTTDKTSGTIRFKNADDSTVDANNPLIVPTSSTEYSYEKQIRVNFNTAPDTNITDLECYSDGTNGMGTGVKVWYRILSTSYVQPGVPTETNDPPQIPVNGTPSAAADFFGLTSGSPGDLGAGPHTSTGEKGNHLCLVMEVETNATQGSVPTEALTIRYDEI